MVYIPTTIITNAGGRLTESTDLSSPMSDYLNKESYVVVEENYTKYVIDLTNILLFENNLNFSDSVENVITGLVSDVFVTKYLRTDIPIMNSSGTYNNRIRVFNPLQYRDHKVQFTSINTPEILDDISKKGYLDDLVITTKFDMTNYLVAVNGVFHRTTISAGKLYVLDGFRTIRISPFKDITIVDTSKIGGHTSVPLTIDNVELDEYNGKALITSPISLRDKTAFLIVDGYFYHYDTSVMEIVNDTHVKVNTNQLRLIEQFRHNPRTMYRKDRLGDDASQKSRKYDDDYDALFIGKRSIMTDLLTTKEFQLSRLTNYHSSLVVVDNPMVFGIPFDIIPTGTPQFYRDHADRVISGMMSYGVGMCPSYVILKDPYKRKSVYIQNQNYDVNIQNETIDPQFLPSVIQDIDITIQENSRLIDYVCA